MIGLIQQDSLANKTGVHIVNGVTKGGYFFSKTKPNQGPDKSIN